MMHDTTTGDLLARQTVLKRSAAATTRRTRAPWVIAPVAVLGIMLGLLVFGTGYSYRPLAAAATPALPALPDSLRSPDALRDLATQRKSLAKTLAQRVPKVNYVVIDRANNRLWLKQGDEILLDANCSVGSGTVLRDLDRGRDWTFDTPRGTFKVLNRIKNPIWRKPDWAFVEEGKPVPKKADDRLEYGVLGEYALYFGDGYMIHGTLYQRLLGRSVTHGCIRLGREDLRTLWAKTDVGMPIYIY